MTDGGSYSEGGTKLASGYKANFNNCVFRNPTSTAQNVIIEDCASLGLNESFLENNTFHIFPNPASVYLFISYMNLQNSKQQILIFNSIGQLVKKNELSETNQINIADLPNGIYFVRLSIYSNQTQKFVKQ